MTLLQVKCTTHLSGQRLKIFRGKKKVKRLSKYFMRGHSVLKQEKDTARVSDRNRVRLVIENREASRVGAGIIDAGRQLEIVARDFQSDTRARREKELDTRQQLRGQGG